MSGQYVGFLRVVREPVVQFVVIGLALLLLHRATARSAGPAERPIAVSETDLRQVRERFTIEMGRAPTAEEQKVLTEQFVDDEVLFREALSLGLDRDDPIIRRRLIQKMQFLSEDLSSSDEPPEKQLEQFLATHFDRYREPARLTFRHVFFSNDRR